MSTDPEIRAFNRWALTAYAAVIAVVVLVSTFAWTPAPQEPARQRTFRDYDVCLLTAQDGLNSPAAQEAWQTLASVSKKTDVSTGFTAVLGDQTEARARQFVTSMAGGGCSIVIPIGETQAKAVAAEKPNYPAVHFVNPGPGLESTLLALIPPK